VDGRVIETAAQREERLRRQLVARREGQPRSKEKGDPSARAMGATAR